jgi:30S ribosomal protein S31
MPTKSRQNPFGNNIISIFAPQTYFMGRGDKKTKKGKIFKGSFGKSRRARAKKAVEAAKKEA